MLRVSEEPSDGPTDLIRKYPSLLIDLYFTFSQNRPKQKRYWQFYIGQTSYSIHLEVVTLFT